MSKTFLFGLGPGHLGPVVAQIAERHEAELVNYTEPGGNKRHWFAAENVGEPFDSERARSVMAEVTAWLRRPQ